MSNNVINFTVNINGNAVPVSMELKFYPPPTFSFFITVESRRRNRSSNALCRALRDRFRRKIS